MRPGDSVQAYTILICQVSSGIVGRVRCIPGRTESAATPPPLKMPGVKRAGKGSGTVAYHLSLYATRVYVARQTGSMRGQRPTPEPPRRDTSHQSIPSLDFFTPLASMWFLPPIPTFPPPWCPVSPARLLGSPAAFNGHLLICPVLAAAPVIAMLPTSAAPRSR